MCVWINILHIPPQRLEINFVFSLCAEEEGQPRSIIVVFCRDDLDALQLKFSCARAAIDHGLGLFRLPGLSEQEVARRGSALDALPTALGRSRLLFQNLDDFAEMPAARGIY